MIARDRELLARLRQVNASLGEVVLALMAAQDGGELPANGLREVGQVLSTLAGDMIARANEIDGSAPVVLTAPPTATCARCSVEQVARPGQPHTTVESHFCADCIDHCLTDTARDHWCPIDTHGCADETGRHTVIEVTAP